jgi:hypothetical protein
MAPTIALALCLLLAGCGREGSPGAGPSPDASADAVGLREEASRAGTVAVIVDLDVEYRPEAGLSPEAVREQRARIARAQRRLVDDLAGHHVELAARYERLPQIALVVGEEALEILLDHPLVKAVHPNAADAPDAPDAG